MVDSVPTDSNFSCKQYGHYVWMSKGSQKFPLVKNWMLQWDIFCMLQNTLEAHYLWLTQQKRTTGCTLIHMYWVYFERLKSHSRQKREWGNLYYLNQFDMQPQNSSKFVKCDVSGACQDGTFLFMSYDQEEIVFLKKLYLCERCCSQRYFEDQITPNSFWGHRFLMLIVANYVGGVITLKSGFQWWKIR